MTAHVAKFDFSTSTERRRDERVVTTYRAARIVTGQGHEQLGIVRNVSVGGMMIETHAAIGPGDRLWIEPRSCQAVWGTVRWSNELRHGVVFDAELPGDCLLTLTTPEAPDRIARAPRISVGMSARLCVAGVWRAVYLCDLSQGGAKLDSAVALTDGEPVVLGVPGLRNVEAYVRWQRKGKIGLLFAEPISIAALSAWIAATRPQARPADSAQPDLAAQPGDEPTPC